MADALWFTPLQIATTLGSAINFGGSSLQSPLVMKMLVDVPVPIHYSGKQVAYLLHNSEYFFPPLNALCSLGNLILTGFAYYYSGKSRTASAKFPALAAATGFNMITTAYALGIMVPINQRLTVLSKEMEQNAAKGEEKSAAQDKAAKEFRQLENKWIKLNLGRACAMFASAVAGAVALVA